MKCQYCGGKLKASDTTCESCGARVPAEEIEREYNRPYGYQNTNTQQAQTPEAQNKPIPAAQTTQSSQTVRSDTNGNLGLAIASLILAFIFPFVGFFMSIVVIRKCIKQKTKEGKSVATLAFIICTISLIINAVLIMIGIITYNSF